MIVSWTALRHLVDLITNLLLTRIIVIVNV